MRILLQTAFSPSIGGIETLSMLLATEWHRAGVSVSVCTPIKGLNHGPEVFPFPVHRRPTPMKLLRLSRTADLVVQMNISLRRLWPMTCCRTPWIAVHHGPYSTPGNEQRGWRDKLKLLCAGTASANICPSGYIARKIGLSCHVIPNAYDASIFWSPQDATEQRAGDLAFVGRLVCEKGLRVLLDALAILKPSAQPRLTIIGDGSERKALEQQSRHLGLASVDFVGAKPPAEVAQLLQTHRILVVPSLSEEPFGIVALEGAACGCVVLGSNGGGLPEAIGTTGATFQRGDAADLAAKLALLLAHRAEWVHYREAAAAHLARHQPARVAAQYLDVFRIVLGPLASLGAKRRGLRQSSGAFPQIAPMPDPPNPRLCF
ncbi:MAG TPA: glycosyltransferase [Verrucomicrobiae bacterium]|nr:glycosyltransferase [Verrucomicrobiae bacterium]